MVIQAIPPGLNSLKSAHRICSGGFDPPEELAVFGGGETLLIESAGCLGSGFRARTGPERPELGRIGETAGRAAKGNPDWFERCAGLGYGSGRPCGEESVPVGPDSCRPVALV